MVEAGDRVIDRAAKSLPLVLYSMFMFCFLQFGGLPTAVVEKTVGNGNM